MSYTIRVARPGYNALTDTDPDRFALFADQDNVLIKELARGTYSIGSSSSATYNHGLGYIPIFMAYYDIGSGKRRWITGQSIYAAVIAYVTEDDLKFENHDTVSRTIRYYIFYDEL